MTSLAEKWEELATVRKRFRIGADWIHVPTSENGVDMPQSTAPVKANFRVTIVFIEHSGCEKLGIKALHKEVRPDQT